MDKMTPLDYLEAIRFSVISNDDNYLAEFVLDYLTPLVEAKMQAPTLEKLGYVNKGKTNNIETYEAPFPWRSESFKKDFPKDIQRITIDWKNKHVSKEYPLDLSSVSMAFTFDELPALAQVINEMENTK